MNIQDQPKICVAIRKRPLNKKQLQKNQNDIVLVKNGETVIVSQYKQKVDLTKYIQQSAFNFDFAFDQFANNQQIYNKAVRPLVESAFMGAKVTCFAYGQTGSGKTYTMNGDLSNGVAGLYYLGANDIFAFQSNKKFQHLKVQVSFFEIYCSRLFDLLNNRNQLKLRQDNKGNVHIVGLQQKPLNSAKQFLTVIDYGSQFRVTSQNSTNADSSRSHAILQITLKEGKKTYGKISFIDLAGCQRGADHMDQNKQTRIDGAQINKSLLSLKQCIRALDQGKGHTPFRGSKLTMVLKDSFVGFCRTVMIGNISPNINSCQNTLNTLRYADRVKQLKKPNSSEPLSKQDQLAKQLMLPRQNNNAVKILLNKDDDAEDIQLKKQQAQKLLGIKNFTPNLQKNSSFTVDNQSNNQNDLFLNNLSRSNKLINNDYNNNNQFFNQNSNSFNQNPQQLQFQQQVVKKPSESNHPRKYSIEEKGPEKKFDQKNQLKKSFINEPLIKNNNYLQDQKTVLMKPNTSFQQNNMIKPELKVTQQQQQSNQSPNQGINKFNKLFQGSSQISQNDQKGYQNSSLLQKNNQNPYNMKQDEYQSNPQQYNRYQMNQNPQLYDQYNDQYNLNQYNQQNQQFNQPQQFNQQQQLFNQQQQFNKPQNQYYNQNNQNLPNLPKVTYQQSMQVDQRNQYFQPPQNIKKINSMSFGGYPNNQMGFKNFPNEIQKANMQNQFYNQTINKKQFNFNQNHDWTQMIAEFRDWNQNSTDIAYYKDAHEYMINKLVQEQEQLTHQHSALINKQIELIKGETKLISEIQQDKQAYESLEYAEYIQNSIETKIDFLMKLKKKVNIFKQHLLEHQECQQKIFRANELVKDDEQLLDDLAVDDEQYNEDNIDYNEHFMQYNEDQLF